MEVVLEFPFVSLLLESRTFTATCFLQFTSCETQLWVPLFILNISHLSIFQDYYTNGYAQPPLDSSQDYKLISASEANGKTTLEFERKRDTGDKNDVQFTVSDKLCYTESRLC